MTSFFSCRECVDLLFDFLEDRMEAQTQKKLEEHLSTCPPCLNFVKSYRTCSEMARKLRDQETQVPTELEFRLKSFLREQLTREA